MCVAVAHLNASEIQYATKLQTPHLRWWRGTGSKSTLVLHMETSISAQTIDSCVKLTT